MDYFDGLTNEDFLAYFLLDLNCRMELTQYIYPHEFFEPDDAVDDHIVRCQNILTNYIRNVVISSGSDAGMVLTTEERNKIVDEKFKELIPLILKAGEKYYNEVVVNYVSFRDSSLPIEDEDIV